MKNQSQRSKKDGDLGLIQGLKRDIGDPRKAIGVTEVHEGIADLLVSPILTEVASMSVLDVISIVHIEGGIVHLIGVAVEVMILRIEGTLEGIEEIVIETIESADIRAVDIGIIIEEETVRRKSLIAETIKRGIEEMMRKVHKTGIGRILQTD